MNTKKREDFHTRMRSARQPLWNAMQRAELAAYKDDFKQAVEALKAARLAVKIIKVAIKRRFT